MILEEEKQKISEEAVLSEEEEEIMKEYSYFEKSPFIDSDQDEFEKHLLQIINQIEVFEKQKAEEEDENLNSNANIKEYNKGEDDFDYTDINLLFEQLKNCTMDTENFSCFLVIMQNLWLIRNQSKNKLWVNLSEALVGLNGEQGILYRNLLNFFFFNSYL